MRKAEIVRHIAEETDLTQVKAEETVDAILDEIKSALEQGDSVILRRFGTFKVRDKNARIGRNPKTGEEAPIAPRRIVRFKPGITFKEVVDSSTPEPIEIETPPKKARKKTPTTSAQPKQTRKKAITTNQSS